MTADNHTEYVFCRPLPHTPTPENYQTINNAPFTSFIKIVKQDAETGKTIPYAGAGFKIYDPDGNPVTMTFTYPTPTTIDVFYTNAEGSLVTPEKLPFGKGYSRWI